MSLAMRSEYWGEKAKKAWQDQVEGELEREARKTVMLLRSIVEDGIELEVWAEAEARAKNQLRAFNKNFDKRARRSNLSSCGRALALVDDYNLKIPESIWI